jgi:hypothetical protein
MLPAHDQIERAAYELWLRRGKIHGLDRTDWLAAENDLAFSMNYRSLVEYPLDAPGTLILGERPARYCRICERTCSYVAFTALCPVLPGLAQTSLYSEALCDECLHHCLEPLTPGFARFWQALSAGAASSEEHGAFRASGLFSTVVLKSLVAGGLLIMPESELRYFVDALEWLCNPNHDDDLRLFAGTTCYVQLVPSLEGRSWAGLARRINDRSALPYMLFFLARNGVVIQIALPLCVRDQDLDGRTERVPVRSFTHRVPPGCWGHRTLVLPLTASGSEARFAGTRLAARR